MRPFLLLLCLPLVACGGKGAIRKFAEEKRGEIEAGLKPFGALPPLLRATPRFTGRQLLEMPSPPPNFAGGNADTAGIYHAEDLDDLGAPGPVPFRQEGRSNDGYTLPDQMAHLVKTGEWKGPLQDVKWPRLALGRLQRQRYALVIRTDRYRKAVRHDDKTFEAAELDGDAVLVDLQRGVVSGGFPLHLRNRDTMSLRVRKGPIRGMQFEESVEEHSDTELLSHLGQELAAGVEQLVPGAVPPYLESYYRERKARYEGR